jgi:hypothetical protein
MWILRKQEATTTKKNSKTLKSIWLQISKLIIFANHHFEAHPSSTNNYYHKINLMSFIKACCNTQANHDHAWSNHPCFDKKIKEKKYDKKLILLEKHYFLSLHAWSLKNCLKWIWKDLSFMKNMNLRFLLLVWAHPSTRTSLVRFSHL